jgi:hypothetical protein
VNVIFAFRSLVGLGRTVEVDPVDDRGVVGFARFGRAAGPSGLEVEVEGPASWVVAESSRTVEV